MMSLFRIFAALVILFPLAFAADKGADVPMTPRPEREAKVLEAFLHFETILSEDRQKGSHRHRTFLHRQFEGDKGGLTKAGGGGFELLPPEADKPIDPKQRAADHHKFLRDPNNGWEVVAAAEGTFEIYRPATPAQARLLRAVMVVDKGKLFVKRYTPGW